MKELTSLAEIFNQKILRIPDYQRGYAWQDDQLKYLEMPLSMEMLESKVP